MYARAARVSSLRRTTAVMVALPPSLPPRSAEGGARKVEGANPETNKSRSTKYVDLTELAYIVSSRAYIGGCESCTGGRTSSLQRELLLLCYVDRLFYSCEASSAAPTAHSQPLRCAIRLLETHAYTPLKDYTTLISPESDKKLSHMSIKNNENPLKLRNTYSV